jgi:hypothetical protein
METKIQVTVSCVETPHSDVVGYKSFRELLPPSSHFTLKVEAARISEMLVSYITTQCHKSEDMT